MSIERRMRRKLDIKCRAGEAPEEPNGKCMAWGCKRPTQRAAGKGLSEMYCKRHIEFKRRHGSAWRKSFSASELKPIREAVRRWMAAHKADKWALRTVDLLDYRLRSVGPSRVTAMQWAGAGLDNRERAFEVLARVCDAGVSGSYLLEAVLTVRVAGEVLSAPRDADFMNTQIAKLIHRKASGTHSEYRRANGGAWRRSKYPRAEGGFMRVLGEIVAARCVDVTDRETVREIASTISAGNT